MKRLLGIMVTLALVISIFPVAVAEGELRPLNVLAVYPKGALPPEEAHEMPMWDDFEALWAEHGIKLVIEYVDEDQYSTVLQARLASNDLPDLFKVSMLDSKSAVNLIETNKVLAIDDILKYSNGSAVKELSKEGSMWPCREKNTYVDGKLWYFGMASMLPSVVSTHDNFGYNAVTGNTWRMKVRQDWLDQFGMKMPTTLDEFFDTLVAFRENDANGNGIKDERMVISTTTCTSQWGGFFDNGVAEWFGLASYPFQLNRKEWKAVVPFLQEGFIPYVEFLKKCIDAEVLYLSDTMTAKTDTGLTAALAQDVVGAYFGVVDVDAAGTPKGAAYSTIGKIVGQEGIEPVMTGSRGWKSWDYYAFRADIDPQLAADYLDFATSLEWSKFFNFGVEGKSFEVLDNGMFRIISPFEREEYKKYGYTDCYNLVGDGVLTRTAMDALLQNYNGEDLIWESYDEFYNSDFFQEFYKNEIGEHSTRNLETWIEVAKTLQKYNQNGDIGMIAPMLTSEEADVLDMYETDLFTYMDELFANLLSGVWSTDNYDEYLDEMNEYGLQEVLDVQQARYDRIVR